MHAHREQIMYVEKCSHTHYTLHTHNRQSRTGRSGVLLNTTQSKRDIKVPLREFSIDDKKMSNLLLTRRNLYTHKQTHTHTYTHVCVISLDNIHVTHTWSNNNLYRTYIHSAHRFIWALPIWQVIDTKIQLIFHLENDSMRVLCCVNLDITCFGNVPGKQTQLSSISLLSVHFIFEQPKI